jgi:hypothetical protein
MLNLVPQVYSSWSESNTRHTDDCQYTVVFLAFGATDGALNGRAQRRYYDSKTEDKQFLSFTQQIIDLTAVGSMFRTLRMCC